MVCDQNKIQLDCSSGGKVLHTRSISGDTGWDGAVYLCTLFTVLVTVLVVVIAWT